MDAGHIIVRCRSGWGSLAPLDPMVVNYLHTLLQWMGLTGPTISNDLDIYLFNISCICHF